jgi:hypothetical protein
LLGKLAFEYECTQHIDRCEAWDIDMYVM